MNIQATINRAAEFKAREVFEQERDQRKSDKKMLQASNSYCRLYDLLVKDAAIKGWDLDNYDTPEPFDYETFKDDVERYKAAN